MPGMDDDTPFPPYLDGLIIEPLDASTITAAEMNASLIMFCDRCGLFVGPEHECPSPEEANDG